MGGGAAAGSDAQALLGVGLYHRVAEKGGGGGAGRGRGRGEGGGALTPADSGIVAPCDGGNGGWGGGEVFG